MPVEQNQKLHTWKFAIAKIFIQPCILLNVNFLKWIFQEKYPKFQGIESLNF